MKFFKKLDARGVAHHLLLVITILTMSIGGTYYLIATHADSNPPQIQLTSVSSCTDPLLEISTWMTGQATTPGQYNVNGTISVISGSFNQNYTANQAEPWNGSGHQHGYVFHLTSIPGFSASQTYQLAVSANGVTATGSDTGSQVVQNATVSPASGCGTGTGGGSTTPQPPQVQLTPVSSCTDPKLDISTWMTGLATTPGQYNVNGTVSVSGSSYTQNFTANQPEPWNGSGHQHGYVFSLTSIPGFSATKSYTMTVVANGVDANGANNGASSTPISQTVSPASGCSSGSSSSWTLTGSSWVKGGTNSDYAKANTAIASLGTSVNFKHDIVNNGPDTANTFNWRVEDCYQAAGADCSADGSWTPTSLGGAGTLSKGSESSVTKGNDGIPNQTYLDINTYKFQTGTQPGQRFCERIYFNHGEGPGTADPYQDHSAATCVIYQPSGGGSTPAPATGWKLSPGTTISGPGISGESISNQHSNSISTNYTFTHSVANLGPQSASTTWQIEGCYEPASTTCASDDDWGTGKDGGNAAMGSGSKTLAKNTSLTVTNKYNFKDKAVKGDRYCQRIYFTNLDPSTPGLRHSDAVCLIYDGSATTGSGNKLQCPDNTVPNATDTACVAKGPTLTPPAKDPFAGCTATYSGGSGTAGGSFQVPCPNSGLQVLGSRVWYNGNFIGPTRAPIFTQAQYNSLPAGESSHFGTKGMYTIIGGGTVQVHTSGGVSSFTGGADLPAAVTNGSVYVGNSKDYNTDGLTVQGPDDKPYANNGVYFNGKHYGPTGQPFYTASQFAALPPSIQKSLKDNYKAIPEEAAGLGHGQVFKSSWGYEKSDGFVVPDAQFLTNKAQCIAIYGSVNNSQATYCAQQMEVTQDNSAAHGVIPTITPQGTINIDGSTGYPFDSTPVADKATCTKALGADSPSLTDCVTLAEDMQEVVLNTNGQAYSLTVPVEVSGKLKGATLTVNNKGTITVSIGAAPSLVANNKPADSDSGSGPVHAVSQAGKKTVNAVGGAAKAVGRGVGKVVTTVVHALNPFDNNSGCKTTGETKNQDGKCSCQSPNVQPNGKTGECMSRGKAYSGCIQLVKAYDKNKTALQKAEDILGCAKRYGTNSEQQSAQGLLNTIRHQTGNDSSSSTTIVQQTLCAASVDAAGSTNGAQWIAINTSCPSGTGRFYQHFCNVPGEISVLYQYGAVGRPGGDCSSITVNGQVKHGTLDSRSGIAYYYRKVQLTTKQGRTTTKVLVAPHWVY